MDIYHVFWSNVFWHIDNKGLKALEVIGSNYNKARKHDYNPSIKKVQEIAEKLDIDDYAILFERVE